MEKMKKNWELGDREENKLEPVPPIQPKDISEDLDNYSIQLTEDNVVPDQVDHGIGKILYLKLNRR